MGSRQHARASKVCSALTTQTRRRWNSYSDSSVYEGQKKKTTVTPLYSTPLGSPWAKRLVASFIFQRRTPILTQCITTQTNYARTEGRLHLSYLPEAQPPLLPLLPAASIAMSEKQHQPPPFSTAATASSATIAPETFETHKLPVPTWMLRSMMFTPGSACYARPAAAGGPATVFSVQSPASLAGGGDP